MPTPPSERFRIGKKLAGEGKYQEALDLVLKIEKEGKLTPDEELESMVFKVDLYNKLGKLDDALEIAEQAYQESLKRGNKLRALDVLAYKSFTYWLLADHDKYRELVIERENLFNSLTGVSPRELTKRKAAVMAGKAGFHVSKGEWDIGLKYQQEALKLYQEMDDKINIAFNLYYIGVEYNVLGKLNQALHYLKQILAIKEIRNFDTIRALNHIADIYRYKGELDIALDYCEQALQLAEELNNIPTLVEILNILGGIYYEQGKLDKASEFLKRSLFLSEESKFHYSLMATLTLLIKISVVDKSIDQANRYLQQMEQLRDLYKIKARDHSYLIARAYLLKHSTHASDIDEAERLLRQIIEETINSSGGENEMALIYLCRILIDKASQTNNPEILNEIKSINNRLQKIAENKHSYRTLVYAYFLQAKLALVEEDIEGARNLLTQAQQVADWHNLDILARIISREHDILLEEAEKWERVQKTKSPLSIRLDLASLEAVFDKILDNRLAKIPELTHEEPVLLLIIAEGGVPAFSNIFTEDWSFENGFISNFLTAFNTFSEEVFSKGLDRAMFGEYMLIMDSVGPFSICYLFKGQSYLAKQKLIQFAHRVQNTSSIWEVLQNFDKTRKTILLSENPVLESLITEIFLKRSDEISTII